MPAKAFMLYFYEMVLTVAPLFPAGFSAHLAKVSEKSAERLRHDQQSAMDEHAIPIRAGVESASPAPTETFVQAAA